MSASTPVGVTRFARVYTDGPEELPAQADTYRDSDGRFYFKLHLDEVSAEDASPLVEKAAEEFDVELVERMQHGDVFKERVYIDHPSEAPGGYKVHQGPNGGMYYETGVERVGTDDGEQRNVAVIHWDDVEEGDEIVYETPEGGETFAEITTIEERGDRADVIHVNIDGESQRAMPGTYTVDKSGGVYRPLREKEGVPSQAVHSERDDEEYDHEDAEIDDVDKDGEDVWTYYYGPNGGEGWMNMRTGEIRYQKQRPGQAPEGGDGYNDWLGDGWAEPPEDLMDLQEGQQVEFRDEDSGEYIEGKVDIVDPEGEYVQVDTGYDDPNGLVMADGSGDELTAMEEIGDVEFAWEQGEQVHLQNDVPEDHPDHFDITGTVDPVLHNGEALYRIRDDNDIVIRDFYEDEMQEYIVDEDLPEGATVDIAWQETEDLQPAEVEYTEGELGFRISDGPYEGAWVHEDHVDNADDLKGDAAEDAAEEEQEGGDSDLPPEEEAFLAEQGLSPGDTFHYEGKEVIVTGGDSMMQDGSISHVEVYVEDADTHLPLSPNSIPEDAGQPNPVDVDLDPSEDDGILGDIHDEIDDLAGDDEEDPLDEDPEAAAEDLADEFDDEADPTGPSEDEAASAVAQPASEEAGGEGDDAEYDATEYDPSDAVNDKDMNSIGASHGNSVSAKHVVEVPGGNEMVHTDLSHDTITLEDGKRQMAGYHAMKHLDDNTLDHSADLSEGGYFANEVAPGVDAKDANLEMKEAVSAQEFHRKAAIQTIIGNADAHQNNVRVDEEGNLYFFDLDRAAGDVNGEWSGDLPYEDTLDRILGEMEKTASALNIPLDRQAVIDHAEAIAEDLDGDTVQAIRNDAADVDEEMGDTIANNIIAFQGGAVEP